MRPRLQFTLLANAAPASIDPENGVAPPGQQDQHHQENEQEQDLEEELELELERELEEEQNANTHTYANHNDSYYSTNPLIPYYENHNVSQSYLQEYADQYSDEEDDLDMSDSDGGVPLAMEVGADANLHSPVSEFEMDVHSSRPDSPASSLDEQPAHPPPFSHFEPTVDDVAHLHTFTWANPTAEEDSGPVYHFQADVSPHTTTTTVSPATTSYQPAPGVTHYFPLAEQSQPAHADEPDDWDGMFPPIPISNLNPDNLGVMDFLKQWTWGNRYLQSMRPRAPDVRRLNCQAATKISKVRYSDLEGDRRDIQGMDWEDLGVTRREARKRRLITYKNYTNSTGSDKWHPHLPDTSIPNTESYFRFRRMDLRQNVHLAHFQLRNVLACAGQSHAYYPGQRAVHKINPLSGQGEVAMDLRDIPGVQISTLDAKDGVLIAGTFNGEYCLRNIDAQDKKYTEGQITSHISGITNHVQIHGSRTSSGPLAAFASNDQGFRVLDVTTGKFVMQTMYNYPMNCSALSTDRRLRVMVGDNYNVFITNAETGEIQQELSGHRDFGFACDWSDDGWTVATGFQDKGVKIWDARRWCNSSGASTPLATIQSEMAGVRSLRFSPLGSGPRVLVAAEEADFVNVIDAQTFGRKQTIDLFGEIGGIAFANDGQALNILCGDRHRGGLVQLERCDMGKGMAFDLENEPSMASAWWRQRFGLGWRDLAKDEHHPRSTKPTEHTRQRRATFLNNLEPF